MWFEELWGDSEDWSKIFKEEILALSKHEISFNTTTLEKEIDVLVYKLYELTYDEIKVVDPDFWLSEEEYKNVRLD
jgi:adenine-specific DNA-methyltransferase